MINLPNSLSKGEVLSFALNKSLVIAAVSDSYWSDVANISKCIVVYRSSQGHQRKRLEFDFTQESPTVVAEWSVKSRNSFEIEEIVLIDFDSGSYTISRTSLPSGKGIAFNVTNFLNDYKIAVNGASVIIKRGANNYVAWGQNTTAAIGIGTTTAIATPTVVTYSVDFDIIDGVVFHSTGGAYAIAIESSSKRAMGWGSNIHGQLGDGTQVQKNTPTYSLGNTQFSEISIGVNSNNSNSSSGYTLALEQNTGKLYTWGTRDNFNSVLARTVTNYNIPVLATNASSLSFKKIYASCIPLALSVNGYLYAWGPTRGNTPVLIDGVRTYVDVMGTENTNSTPADKAFFTMDSTGKIYSSLSFSGCTNLSGILGNGTTTNSYTLNEIAGSRFYSKMSCGVNHAAAIEKTTNKLYMWGNNAQGQLGDGTTTNRSSPVLIAGDKQFSDVKCGDKFTIAIEKDTNDIYVWGSAANYRLGNGSNTGTVLTPTKITLP